ncbi:MAG: hypothetical protein SPH82_02410 [Eubacteriales bacterium]|nr:hypothetical protein [Eubacteriales bacterium]
MNAILSILVCFAMLFSGGAALPAQPETATTRTLRNLTIAVDGESVTLTPQARFTTAIGSDVARLQFEIVDGERMLLPMAGELTADGVRFSLGQNGNVYSISGDDLLELMDMDGTDAQVFALLGDYMTGYSALLSRSITDAAFQRQVSDAALAVLSSACGAEAEDVEVDIYGVRYPGQRLQGELTADASMDLLEGILSCGIPELEDMMRSYLLLVNVAAGFDGDDATGLLDGMREELAASGIDFSIPFDMCWFLGEDAACSELALDFSLDGVTLQMNMRAQATADDADVEMSMHLLGDILAGDSMQMDLTLTEQIVDLERLHMEVSASSQSDSFSESEMYDPETDAHETRIDRNSNRSEFTLCMDSSAVDGLVHTDVTAATVQTIEGNSGEYVFDSRFESGVNLTAEDRLEDDGSVTTAVAMDIDADGRPVQISFELNRAETAATDPFAGAQVYALNADAEDAAFDRLTTEVFSLSADAMTLCANDSVIALTQLLDLDMGAEDFDEIDPSVYDEYYDDSVTVDSFEAAAEIYGGVLPDFTAPEGFTLDGINVGEAYFVAEYVSDDGHFSLSGLADSTDATEMLTVKDGALAPVEGAIAKHTRYFDMEFGYADVYTADGAWMLSYFDLDDAQVKAILADLMN